MSIGRSTQVGLGSSVKACFRKPAPVAAFGLIPLTSDYVRPPESANKIS